MSTLRSRSVVAGLALSNQITSEEPLPILTSPKPVLGTDPRGEPVTSVLPTPALAQHATNGFGLALLNAMPQQSGRV
jgi:hypothetical protein